LPREILAAALLLAALVLAALGAWLWRRRRIRLTRRRRRRLLPRPRRPVVLVHGLFGFDEIALGSRRHAYFKGVGSRLEREGRRVVHLKLPPMGPVEARARQLAEGLRALDGPPVIALAHSMGGLDARYAIGRLGAAPQVAALVTVGTPHRGTPLADLTADLAGRIGLARALALAGVGLEALHDLTGAGLERFNEEVPDVGSVAYGSVVGAERSRRRMNPLLIPSHVWLSNRVGPNDGVVPADSQRWGEVLAEIEADHWAQIGWSRHFDAGAFYARLLREVERGL
jgi:triacylglycerol lipase